MVVPVLMTSCQVSLKPKSGPLSPQSRTNETAIAKLAGRPASTAILRAMVEKLKLVIDRSGR